MEDVRIVKRISGRYWQICSYTIYLMIYGKETLDVTVGKRRREQWSVAILSVFYFA